MSEHAIIRTADHGAVQVLMMNLPDKRNALTTDLRDGMIDAVRSAYAEPAIRALVLTGVGKSFCAGGDLDGLPLRDPLATRARMSVAYGLVRLLAGGPKPVIAAVNGNAFGAGMSLAMACDYVLGTASTRFCSAFSKVGLMGDLGLAWSLSRRIGPGELRRHLMCAPVVEGAEAHRQGMIDRLCQEDALLDDALKLAREFAEAPPIAAALTKALLVRGGSLDDMLAAELDGQTLLFSSADHDEGRRAFFERRAAQFRGL